MLTHFKIPLIPAHSRTSQVDRVVLWLRHGIGLPQYEAVFTENNVAARCP